MDSTTPKCGTGTASPSTALAVLFAEYPSTWWHTICGPSRSLSAAVLQGQRTPLRDMRDLGLKRILPSANAQLAA